MFTHLICMLLAASLPALGQVAGTQAAGEAKDGLVHSTSSLHGATLVLEVPARVPVLQPVRVSVRLTNGGTRDLTFAASSRYRATQPWLLHYGRTLAPWTQLGKEQLEDRAPGAKFTYTVKPGESWQVEYDLRDLYELKRLGVYHLTVSRWIDADQAGDRAGFELCAGAAFEVVMPQH